MSPAVLNIGSDKDEALFREIGYQMTYLSLLFCWSYFRYGEVLSQECHRYVELAYSKKQI